MVSTRALVGPPWWVPAAGERGGPSWWVPRTGEELGGSNGGSLSRLSTLEVAGVELRLLSLPADLPGTL